MSHNLSKHTLIYNTSLFKAFWRKDKVKEGEPNRMPQTLMPFLKMIKPIKGDNPIGKQSD